MDLSVYDSASLPDLLPLYYRRLFPFSQYYKWLNYGGGEIILPDMPRFPLVAPLHDPSGYTTRPAQKASLQ